MSLYILLDLDFVNDWLAKEKEFRYDDNADDEEQDSDHKGNDVIKIISR